MTPRPFQIREPFVPEAPVVSCPIVAGLGVLARKWALPVLRDVAFRYDVRFSDILRNNPGLTRRALSACLRQLRADGLIVRVPSPTNGREAFYDLTAKGLDAIPVLTAVANFSFRNMPEAVFADGKARDLVDVMPNSQCAMLGPLAEYARAGEARPQTLDVRERRG